jgi:hypothetical protein
VFPVMLVRAAHFHSSSCLGAAFTLVSYCSGVSSGSLRTNATTSQSRSSSWVTPQAGMPGHFHAVFDDPKLFGGRKIGFAPKLRRAWI